MDDYRELMDKLHLSSEKYFEIQNQIRNSKRRERSRRIVRLAVPLVLMAAFFLLVKVTQQPVVTDPPVLQGAPVTEYQSLGQLEKAFGQKLLFSETAEKDFTIKGQRLISGEIAEVDLQGADSKLTYRVGPQQKELLGNLDADSQETVTLANGRKIQLLLDEEHRYIGGYTDQGQQRYFLRGVAHKDKAYYVKLLEID